jgi:hypothetical protein
MALPDLYLEGLMQRALLGEDRLNAYKLGLIQAILKAALGADDADAAEALRSDLKLALEVARWETPQGRPSR